MNPKSSFLKTLATPMGFTKQRQSVQATPPDLSGASYNDNPGYFSKPSSNGATPATPPAAPSAPTKTKAATSTPAAQNYINSMSGSSLSGLKTGLENLSSGLASFSQQQQRDPYKEAMDSYMASLAPSEELTRAKKSLSDLDIQTLRDEEEALNRGETLGFARGEAERTNRNNAIERMARAASVDALSGDYKARTEATKARLDYEKSMRPEEKSITEKYGSGAIGEYNFAKEQGYKGTFQEYQNEDANRKARAAGPTAASLAANEKAARQGAHQKLGKWLSGLVGGDGYVSPSDYKKAKAAWVSDGFSSNDFDAIFNNFINPGFEVEYKL